MRPLFLLIAVTLACASAGANAQEYRFNVPVNLAGIPPEIQEIAVRCSISALRSGSTTAFEEIGFTESARTKFKESYNANIAVSVSKSPLAAGRDVAGWRCSLRLYGNVAGRPIEFRPYEPVPGSGDTGIRSFDTSPVIVLPSKDGVRNTTAVVGRI
jgi:hypothetical protein